jgi:phosphatidylinositol alpha-mannosyltransferase
LSLLATWSFDGPIVATFHTSVQRARTLAAAYPILQTALEKISARIAVSQAARRTLVEHLGGDAVLIPNGVSMAAFADVEPFPGWPGDGGALGFLGRFDEARKGLPVLLAAFEKLAQSRPGLRLLVAGPGDPDEVRDALPAGLADRVELLGLVSDADKARMLASVDVYVAPNIGGESFGIVLLEAMAVGTPVLASDLEAFRAVLDGGRSGRLFAIGDSDDLAAIAAEMLDDPGERAALVRLGRATARSYDWSTVARDIERVYETVALPAATPRGPNGRR